MILEIVTSPTDRQLVQETTIILAPGLDPDGASYGQKL
jgi:hypothetical protein